MALPLGGYARRRQNRASWKMRVYDLRDSEGRVFAFEVKNFFLERSRVCRVVSKIPGVRIIRRPKILSWFREEVFCEFELEGVTFVAWEPFGDSDTCWIGPEPTRWVPQIESVREAFIHE
jgi:hypothetical protein